MWEKKLKLIDEKSKSEKKNQNLMEKMLKFELKSKFRD